MSKPIRLLLLSTLLIGTACSKDERGDAPRPPVTVTVAPDAPTILAPSANDVVVSPVAVSGRGEAGLMVRADVIEDGVVLGTATSQVDGGGVYALSVSFEGATTTELTVRVVQSNAAGSSPPAEVRVQREAPPPPPALTAPGEGAEVASPLLVSGTAEAGATVAVVVEASDVVGRGEAVAGSDGRFELRVAYAGPADGDALSVRVTQSTSAGTSEPATRSVVHRPKLLSGTVRQPNGPFDGTRIFVRLYDAPDGAPIAEAVLDVAEDQPVSGVPFSFDVADGRYFVRAYRDAHGPFGDGPDGRPTIPFDPQSTFSAPIDVSGSDSTGHAVELRAPIGNERHYEGFDVRTEHESAEPFAPGRWDSIAQDWVAGQGLCGGFYLRMHVRQRTGGDVTRPRVRRPDGTVVQLVDDGGCSGDVADNRGSSYDERSQDGELTFGVPNPDDSMAGTYVFFYRDMTNDLIHEETDEVSTIVALERNRPLTSPDGADAAPLSPTFEWAAVPGAAAYELHVDGAGGVYRMSSSLVRVPSFTATQPLPDDSTFRATIDIYDADYSNGGDVDAHARSVTSFFLTDADGDSTVVISGNIVNDSGVSGPYLVFVDADRGPDTSTVLPASATTYAVRSFARDTARVVGFVDEHAVGEPDNREMVSAEIEVDARSDVTRDLEFRSPVRLVSPSHGAAAMGVTPRLVWSDYGDHAPSGPWSYGLYMTHGEFEGIPQVVWGLPNTTTAYDLANPPPGQGRYDVVYLASCFESGGSFSGGTCTGGQPRMNVSDLGGHAEWSWGVVILQCDYADWTGSVDRDSNGIDDYTECVMTTLSEGSLYASSPEWEFTTD